MFDKLPKPQAVTKAEFIAKRVATGESLKDAELQAKLQIILNSAVKVGDEWLTITKGK